MLGAHTRAHTVRQIQERKEDKNKREHTMKQSAEIERKNNRKSIHIF